MYNEMPLNTDAALNRIREAYKKKYEEVLRGYNVSLVFDTLLEYYTGSCSLVVEMKSANEARGRVEMIYMVDCHKNDFMGTDEEMEDFFGRRIYKPYHHFFKLTYLIADFNIGRKVFIKDTVATDAIISIKIDQDLIYLDINGHRLEENEEKAADLKALLKCLSVGLA